MRYTHAIYYKDGQNLTVTEAEAEAVKAAIKAGIKHVEVQKQLISVDTIAKVGNHWATALMRRYEEAQAETQLQGEGKFEIVDEYRRIKRETAMANALKEEKLIGENYIKYLQQLKIIKKEQKLQTSEEAMEGKPLFYLDKNGEEMFA